MDKADLAGRMLRAAQSYAERFGWLVFPLHEMTATGDCSCGHADCSPAKHPRTLNGLRDATTDPATIQDWWSRWPTANIGIRTGKESGLFVLDIDLGGEDALQHLQEDIGPFPDTVEQHTGSGGRHLLFNHPGEEIRNSAGRLGRGLDVRCDGGYFVAACSGEPSLEQERRMGGRDLLL